VCGEGAVRGCARASAHAGAGRRGSPSLLLIACPVYTGHKRAAIAGAIGAQCARERGVCLLNPPLPTSPNAPNPDGDDHCLPNWLACGIGGVEGLCARVQQPRAPKSIARAAAGEPDCHPITPKVCNELSQVWAAGWVHWGAHTAYAGGLLLRLLRLLPRAPCLPVFSITAHSLQLPSGPGALKREWG